MANDETHHEVVPGFGNWMSTDGHRFGATGLRWNQAEDDVEPEVRVIAV